MTISKVNCNFRVVYDLGFISAAWSYDACLYFRGQGVPGFGKNVLNVTKYTPTTSKHFKALLAELAVEGEGTLTPVEVDDLSKDASVDSLVDAANDPLGKRRGEQSFGLVIADMNMPRCDGLELLRRHPRG